MENLKILKLAKFLFWSCFILGNICLFGYMISGNQNFALGGYFLLVFGTIINLIALFAFIIIAILEPKYYDECIKASVIILINVPFAILYFYIGTSLLN